MTRDEWLERRSFVGASFDPGNLAERKQALGLSVTACLPTLNVADSVGPICEAVRSRWMGGAALVDELLVVDSHSADGTDRIAAAAGASVVQDDEVMRELGAGWGKGEALWKGLAGSFGDLVVFLDADVEGFDPAFVPGLLGPLLTEPEVGYVKAHYRRPLGESSHGGARVTEICARPLLNLFYPDLAALVQPLSGEAAGRRELLERLPFFCGYAVEIGLVIDVYRRFGLAALAQVDLGERRHAHQETAALGRMAYAIDQAVLRRLAEDDRLPALDVGSPYVRPVPRDGALVLEETAVAVGERPPLVDVIATRR